MRTTSPGRTLTRSFHPTPIVALALGSALASVGCVDENFNQPTLLKLPRVLAVQAEPPQPSFGSATTLRALVYEPTLKTVPPECAADPGPKYQWSWCPMPTSSTDGYKCPMEQADVDMLFLGLGVVPAPQLDLGTGETATLINPFPSTILYSICKGELPLVSQKVVAGLCRYSAGDHVTSDDPQSLANSHPLAFPVTIKLQYTPSCGMPKQEKYGTPLTTVYTVFLSADDTVPPNQNPTVGTLLAYPALKGSAPIRRFHGPDAGVDEADAITVADGGTSDGGGASDDGGAGIDGGSAPEAGGPINVADEPPAGTEALDGVIFPRQKRVGLWLEVPMSAIELLPRPGVLDVVKDDKNAMQVYYIERLNISWYAEDGDFGGQHGSGGGHTGFSPPINATSLTAADVNTLEEFGRENLIAMSLHEDYSAPTARVVVVVRDSRGGVTWTSGTITMEDRP